MTRKKRMLTALAVLLMAIFASSCVLFSACDLFVTDSDKDDATGTTEETTEGTTEDSDEKNEDDGTTSESGGTDTHIEPVEDYTSLPAAGIWHGNVDFIWNVNPGTADVDIAIDENGFGLSITNIVVPNPEIEGRNLYKSGNGVAYTVYEDCGMTEEEHDWSSGTYTYGILGEDNEIITTIVMTTDADPYEETLEMSFVHEISGVSYTFEGIEIGRIVYDTDIRGVDVELSDVTVDTGSTLTATALVDMRLGGADYAGEYVWASSDETVLSVEANTKDSSSATITALARGTATVTLTLGGEGYETMHATSEEITSVTAHAVSAKFEFDGANSCYFLFPTGTNLYTNPNASYDVITVGANGGGVTESVSFTQPTVDDVKVEMSKKKTDADGNETSDNLYDYKELYGTSAYTWTSSNPDFVEVDKDTGELTFRDVEDRDDIEKNARITVTLNNGVTAFYVIAVKDDVEDGDPVTGTWTQDSVYVKLYLGSDVPLASDLSASIEISHTVNESGVVYNEFTLQVIFDVNDGGLGMLLGPEVMGAVEDDGVLDLFVNQDWYKSGGTYYVVMVLGVNENEYYEGVIEITIDPDTDELLVAFDDEILLDIGLEEPISVRVVFDARLTKSVEESDETEVETQPGTESDPD